MDRYQGEAGQVIDYGTQEGTRRTLKADAAGVINARTTEDVEVLERAGLSKITERAPSKPAADREG